VEIKAIDPPKSVKDAMEKQMRAEREKRATILNAEGVRQAQILTAEGEKQSAILRAEGDKRSAVLRAEGQASAITEVFQSIHRNDADPKLLAYQYLQMLPQLAAGEGNTFWVIPSDFTTALQSVTKAFAGSAGADAAAADATAAGGDAGAGGGSGGGDAESAAEPVLKLTQVPHPKPVEAVDQPSAIAKGPAVIPAQANGSVTEGMTPD
jgi:hypothetical protein